MIGLNILYQQKINITLPIDKVKNFKKADEVTLEFPKNHARVINQ